MFSKYIDIAAEIIEQHDDLEYSSLKFVSTRFSFDPEVRVMVRARHIPTRTVTRAEVSCEDDEQQILYAVDTAAEKVVDKIRAELDAESILEDYSADEVLEAARRGGLQ